MKRVLFVDDEPKLLEGLRRMLRGMRHEWELVFVNDGPLALECMKKQPYHIVVSDIRMPGMDGTQLLEEIRTHYPETARILLSGQCDRETMHNAVHPAHQFLMKPCDSQSMQSTFQRICRFQEAIQDQRYRSMIPHLVSLPSIHKVYSNLRNASEGEQGNVDTLAKIIARDVGMSAKVLQLVSTSFFGSPQIGVTPHRAAVLLGLETLKQLVNLPEVFRPAESHCMDSVCRELTDHSLRVAQIARVIAASEIGDAESANLAYTAGLFHDIGMLIFMEATLESTPEASPTDECNIEALWNEERRHHAQLHMDAGAYLLSLWGMPEDIANVAAFHHSPRLSNDQRFSPLAAVHVADVLARERLYPGQDISSDFDTAYLARIGCENRLPLWRNLSSAFLDNRVCL